MRVTANCERRKRLQQFPSNLYLCLSWPAQVIVNAVQRVREPDRQRVAAGRSDLRREPALPVDRDRDPSTTGDPR
jgi:hypothetical protein